MRRRRKAAKRHGCGSGRGSYLSSKQEGRVAMLQKSPPKRRPSPLRHGAWSRAAVVPGEDPRQFDRLYGGLIEEWAPCGPAEEDAVLTLASCLWRKRRARNLRDKEYASDDGWWLPREL